MRVHLTWMFEFEKRNRRVGMTALEIMSWDGENCASHTPKLCASGTKGIIDTPVGSRGVRPRWHGVLAHHGRTPHIPVESHLSKCSELGCVHTSSPILTPWPLTLGPI